MINFTDSLQLGLQTALDRERNFQEIHDVFSTLKDQILAFSNNSVTLEMLFQTDPEDDNTIGDYFESLTNLYIDKTIYLINVDEGQNYEWLSMINFSSNGYPCTITIDGNRFDSIDKVSLEENIKMLLSTPSTGQKLFRLMKSAGKI
ncbi:hypothetical protein ACKEN5_18030 [Acinetobacter baumannii]|uniref:hypothetical protein n=1 Tax=Acinetobacter baumannii TaxID=470 RepID=UPI0018FFEF2C|nr:hypothetical protein [Acinetobacter baumannii]MBJ9482684.1 hypothetical protein [Acinetobacter baumannii]MBJ9912582.1 hypothetical protein [Acinetobacter baumannii]MBJ9943945.1 hypothetical protein [Acinetobacter baumannii]